MKENLEHIIKKSLEGYEAPYNPSAWEAMRSKLDTKMPVQSPGSPKSSNLKWYVAASVVTGIAIASYFIFTNDTAAPTDADKIANEVNTIDEVAESPNNNATPTINNVTDNSTSDNGENQPPFEAPNVNNTISIPLIQSNKVERNNELNHNPINNENPFAGDNGRMGQNGTITPSSSNKLDIPHIGDLCQNESFTVKNVNDVPLLVSGPDLYFIIPAKESRKIKAKNAGLHTIGALDTQAQSSHKEFMVKEAPAADFMVDLSTKFEDGLPTTKVESTVPGANYEWVFNNSRAYGSQADAHFYTKGEHNVSLTVTAGNGCKTTVTKPVYVEETYNLMAMDGFRPNSTDPTTNTFMPYALLKRGARFTMIIIDPNDGRIIFETNEAARGWDGTDTKTGSPVPMETTYIWKVTIENKEANEVRNEYTGRVTVSSSTR